jgi:hypothetical protein
MAQGIMNGLSRPCTGRKKVKIKAFFVRIQIHEEAQNAVRLAS